MPYWLYACMDAQIKIVLAAHVDKLTVPGSFDVHTK